MSKFVKASKTTSEIEKQSQIESIQNKLKRKRPDPARGEDEEEAKPDPKPKSPPLPRVSERDRRRRSRSGSRERSSRRQSRSRDRDSDRRRRRSGSESDDGARRRRRRSRSPRYRRKERRGRIRSRSLSPSRERSRGKVEKERSSSDGGADYSKLIQGYVKMSAAERVKAKMKLQLAETADKDTTKGMEGWERFEFNKDVPHNDEEVEVADDDAALVNHIGKSFRFSSFETKSEDRIRAAHDEAMFGTSDNAPTIVIDNEIEAEKDNKDSNKIEPPSLLSEKVLAKKQGSWCDRIRQNKN